jgi:hypothetical protein
MVGKRLPDPCVMEVGNVIRFRTAVVLLVALGALATQTASVLAVPGKLNGKCRKPPYQALQGGPTFCALQTAAGQQPGANSTCVPSDATPNCSGTVYATCFPGSCATTSNQYCDDSKTGTPGGPQTILQAKQYAWGCTGPTFTGGSGWSCGCTATATGMTSNVTAADVNSGGTPDC